MAVELIFFGFSAAGNTAGNTTVCKSDGTAAVPIINTDLGASGGIGSELLAPGPVLLDYGKTILAQGYIGQPKLWIYTKPAPPAMTGTYTSIDFDPAPAFGFVEYKGLVYFNGTAFATGYDLFSTNGTVAGTIPVTASGLNPTSLAVAYNKLFFAGGSDPNTLYSYDGSSSPPAPVGVDVVSPSSLSTAFVGTLFFLPDPDLPFFHPPQPPLFMSGQDSSGSGIWLFQYDGSSLTKIAPSTAPSIGLAPYNLVNLGWVQTFKAGRFDLEARPRALCFSGQVDNSGTRRVWISLGTSGTTNQIPMPSVPGVVPYSYPYDLTAFNGMLYFTAYDTAPADGRGLFVYDPVTDVTRQIIESSAYNLDPGNWQETWGALNQYTMAVFNNYLYFNATKAGGQAGGPSLWRIDGAPTFGQATPQLVSDVGGQDGLQPYSLTTANL
jgi:hypothetical protein